MEVGEDAANTLSYTVSSMLACELGNAFSAPWSLRIEPGELSEVVFNEGLMVLKLMLSSDQCKYAFHNLQNVEEILPIFIVIWNKSPTRSGKEHPKYHA